jgi:formylglycine-generating enzyme required for sulfatase activity
LQPLIKNRVGIELVLIKPGVFRMGTYAINHTENYLGAGADRRPEHQVTIRDLFYIGKYEVTQAQWQRVMGTNPSEYKGENLPVGNISWIETQEFIQKLNTMNDGFTYRLPAEAEWEYACRAGTTEDYAGDLDSMAWYGNNSGQGYLHADYIPGYEYSQRLRANGNQPHPVGTKKPNGFGLYDMHGNVLEWCQDAYHGDYEGAPTDGSAWEDGKAQEARMQRGGSYFAFNWLCSSAYRTAEKVDDRKRTVGFRLVAVART